jgi:2-acylglycerol O-acyltransferase 2
VDRVCLPRYAYVKADTCFLVCAAIDLISLFKICTHAFIYLFIYSIGGTREALYSNPEKEEVLDLRRKQGFIQLCMHYDIAVVPCYTFNEVDHFSQVSYWDLKSHYPIVMAVRVHFQYLFGIMLPLMKNAFPRGAAAAGKQDAGHVVTVVGRPLRLPHIKNPSAAELTAGMEAYICCLQELYDTHAPVYNSQPRTLVIT